MTCPFCQNESIIYSAACKDCTVRRVARLTPREIGAILDGVEKDHGRERAILMRMEIASEYGRLKAIGQL